MKKIILLKGVFIVLFSIIRGKVIAQKKPQIPVVNPPINTEQFFSNRGVAFQMIIDKKFQSIPKLGFFSVTSLVGEWNNDKINDK